METMLDFKEKVHEQEVLKLMYTIWRLKYGLRASKRLDIQMSQMKTGTLGQLNMGIESIRTINGKIKFNTRWTHARFNVHQRVYQ
jgi:hypothetical protein